MKLPKRRHAGAMALAALLSISAAPRTAFAEVARHVLLVHGAFVDGSGWREVYDILAKRGFHVVVVQQPMTSLADDVSEVRRVLDQQASPTILVGHSYGGVIITEAGDDPKVAGLVYIAALQPDVGESVSTLAGSAPQPSNDIRPIPGGYLRVPGFLQAVRP
ncbi:pimeloyl-ACP methyl ester carboxylesterase [Inquilinus ginsengisoli]|uniref:alpha/beta fold hydrolase n=1 Tax=Inquilinus ginsengisoli TaxID=363840 RepID=UPI003D1EBD46